MISDDLYFDDVKFLHPSIGDFKVIWLSVPCYDEML